MNDRRLPWFAALLLVRPRDIDRALRRLEERRALARVPNAWQVALGVARMWHRVLFRSHTIGTSGRPVRPTWRARMLSARPLRFPFLVAERAIAPLDFSGLLSSRERVIRHLLAAHHDKNQFAYDLEMLAHDPGALEELLSRARAVVEGSDPRAEWLRDLTVHVGYHEDLLAAAERAVAGDLGLSEGEARDPDISFAAYLAWCARQPPTFDETVAALRAGRYTLAEGLA
jgi:hypothetical protein